MNSSRGGALRRLFGRRLVRAGAVTYVFSGLTLTANLVTGVVTARALGPDGRGVTVALLTVSQLAGLLVAMGAAQSLSYYIARRPEDGPTLLTTWVLMLIPLAAVGILATELLLDTIFAVDGEEAIAIGRWFMFSIVLVVGLELIFGLLLGVQDFYVYNALRLAQPALTAAIMVVLWALDELTVELALVSAVVGSTIAMAVGAWRALALIGAGPPDLRLGLGSLWYGLRGQGAALAPNLTARLDIAMLPAFVAAAGVGLYSVATNVSLIVFQLSNTFAGLVLPAAASEPERARIKVVGSLWASLAIAGAVALLLGLLAGPLLELVYGEEFRAAAESLRLLLPGAVLFAGSAILAAGVYAAGRPFTATLAQLTGAVVTVVGLLVFLPGGGITTAALVSTAAYAAVFAATLVAYRSVSGMSWGELLPTPARLRALSQPPPPRA